LQRVRWTDNWRRNADFPQGNSCTIAVDKNDTVKENKHATPEQKEKTAMKKKGKNRKG
jgi:hypothetical protein